MTRPPSFRATPVASPWLMLPITALYLLLAALPIGVVFRLGLADGGSHVMALLHSRLLQRAALNTVVISLVTTIISLLLAFLLSALLWRAGPRLRGVLFAFVLLPFWTGVLIKNFAWAALLQDNGAINAALQALGLTTAPVTLLHNRLAVVIGMVHYVLPYAVFPIYTAMSAIDPQLTRAAVGLGASGRIVVWRVVLPLSLPGIAASALLSFIVSAGFYVTPVILGAPSDMMVANLVDYYVHELVDFDGASALAVIILLAVSLPVILQQRLPSRGQYGRA